MNDSSISIPSYCYVVTNSNPLMMSSSNYSHIFNAEPEYIDTMYKQYLSDKASVDDGWRLFFDGFQFADTAFDTADSLPVPSESNLLEEFRLIQLINAYRERGHLLSDTNPIRPRRDRKPRLDIEDFGFTTNDLSKAYQAGRILGLGVADLSTIVSHLKDIYCKKIGFEYRHIFDQEQVNWLEQRIEKAERSPGYGLSLEKKKRILEKLNGAVTFERFLHTKYVGQKRFSLEGGESTIPALDAIIRRAAENGVEEVIIGMAHRGRLNVLANIMGKTYEQIFNEFEGTAVPDLSFGDGDVKYHLGFSSQIPVQDDKLIQLKLTPNPSHLESVNPVVLGFARAKADLLYQNDNSKVLPILVHGDAAVAGQGVVYETAQMAQLEGYYTGGTIHFVINNQIGFTTDFDDARSSVYCTASGNVIQAPIFHVNGDDPEAVVFAVELAVSFRQQFGKDVYVDMVCYRRHGHNEGDDPKFTQPEMYKIISTHPNPRELYSKVLTERGDVEADLAKAMEDNFWSELQNRLDLVKEKPLPYTYQKPEQAWRKLKRKASKEDIHADYPTGISQKKLKSIMQHLMKVPEDFKPLGKVNRLLKGKQKLLDAKKYDWAMAEWLAFGSLLLEGHNIRMSGQDCKRGTFSHRHAVFNDAQSYEEYNRFEGLGKDQGRFMIYNSLLSEFAVLGFEYGYSMSTPDDLVIWEAQFGDFYNGAQVMVDQYIVAGESKWRRNSGLVMLLPHGYAGQGPEHSSARLERFLQQCAEDNITVANITSPANFFHILRRQLVRPFRKPLIIMSPKSLLRHPLCVSPESSFLSKESFRPVIFDSETNKHKQVKKHILCSGKIYYDLFQYRAKHQISDVAITRIEQLYPFPIDAIRQATAKYPNAKQLWVQEEPLNMGAWSYIYMNLKDPELHCISRKASASPATGYKKVHDKQQNELITKAFNL